MEGPLESMDLFLAYVNTHPDEVTRFLKKEPGWECSLNGRIPIQGCDLH